jgi:hypothetical protein
MLPKAVIKDPDHKRVSSTAFTIYASLLQQSAFLCPAFSARGGRLAYHWPLFQDASLGLVRFFRSRLYSENANDGIILYACQNHAD